MSVHTLLIDTCGENLKASTNGRKGWRAFKAVSVNLRHWQMSFEGYGVLEGIKAESEDLLIRWGQIDKPEPYSPVSHICYLGFYLDRVNLVWKFQG